MGRKSIVLEPGEKIGFLEVIGLFSTGKYTKYKCRCICNKEVVVTSSDLKRNHTTSCGCFGKPPYESTYSCLYGNYRRHAERRKLAFELSLEEFIEISKMSCYYCGIPPYQIYHKKGLRYEVIYNGIDRKKNSLGYTKDNCFPCCGMCNFGKKGKDVDSFLVWIERLYLFQKQLGNIGEPTN